MHLHEIVIEGFKSYAQRTVVGPFDPHFNAITGLNGSGKSNILDAICFVLGISNLSQVRAGNLQELVYKQGQAGVTKASVNIVFDNTDKKNSPVGYEECDQITVTRQVVIGGRNKYLVNGVNAQQQRVQNLFHSVQLNVNNPHFLIMQGRITKVLNMKPPEILSMIEEAAGTRMFENKKDAALKTIEKKEKKLEEINTILNEEITPTLEKLRKERSSYLEYQKTQMECERLSRFCIAYDFARAEKFVLESSADLTNSTEEMARLKSLTRNKQNKIVDLEQNIAILEKKRDQETGGSLSDLEKSVTELSKELVKLNSTLQHKREAHEGEIKSKQELLKGKKDLETSISKKEQEKLAAGKKYEQLKTQSDQAAQGVEQLQRRIHGFSVAKSDDGSGRVKTFADELLEAKQDASAAMTAQKDAKMKAAHISAELKKKERECKATEKEYAKLQEELLRVEGSVAALEKKLGEAGGALDPKKEASLVAEKAAQESLIAELRDKCDALSAKLSALDFSYADPEAGFDRTRVKGLVASLINVRDPQVYSTALEITAGGRLYNVVVDTEQTGQLLLQKGKLKKRVTIIPLNKIHSSKVSSETVRLAEREVGKGNVSLALSLVGYDEELEAAMAYVFGSTLVCKTMEFARRVTFNPSIRTRSVTLDGDVFDPSGTLTGGATAPSSSSVLAQLTELQNARASLADAEGKLKSLVAQLASLRKNADASAKLSRDLELARHEAELVRGRIKQNTHHAILQDMENLRQEMERLEQATAAAAEREKACQAQCERIERDMKSFNSQRESEQKHAESEITKAKSAASKAGEVAKEQERQLEIITLELVELRKELAQIEEQLVAIEGSIASLSDEVSAADQSLGFRKGDYETAKAELARKKEKIHATERDISALAKECDECRKSCTDAEIEYKKLEHKISRLQQELKDASRRVEQLLGKHDWIATEKVFFGEKNTAYDFSDKDPEECRKRLSKLEETQSKIAKSINMKVLNMFGKAEQEYNDLMKKKKIVENDKDKIEAAIAELDVKKNEALKKTYQQVNRDFGSIFSTLLPGTNAKLAPPEGQSVLDGLEVKVAFGGVWKESLTELSGGQRSLIALSLILSLLLFKPAPMYILDEVDAALDLSHTQNIGNMLRTHFSQSQFIVVSLKDGMFNNANVLFKTKFVDGISTVSRTVQPQKAIAPGQHKTFSAPAATASSVSASSSSSALVSSLANAPKTAKQPSDAAGSAGAKKAAAAGKKAGRRSVSDDEADSDGDDLLNTFSDSGSESDAFDEDDGSDEENKSKNKMKGKKVVGAKGKGRVAPAGASSRSGSAAMRF